MISKKSLLITTISIIAAGLLAVWLYITFHILFIFLFLPLVFIGPAFGRRRGSRNRSWWEEHGFSPDKDEDELLLPGDKPKLPDNPDSKTDQI